MAEYIELTEELELALNAGARAIENTKRYHSAFYSNPAISASSKISFPKAAEVLRDASVLLTADVAPVVRCKDCENSHNVGGQRRCAHGTCCGRAVPPDFYCAEGKRKEKKE